MRMLNPKRRLVSCASAGRTRRPGAGDTIVSVICAGIDDLGSYELAYLSAIAAKISVEKAKTATVSVKELLDNIAKL